MSRPEAGGEGHLLPQVSRDRNRLLTDGDGRLPAALGVGLLDPELVHPQPHHGRVNRVGDLASPLDGLLEFEAPAGH